MCRTSKKRKCPCKGCIPPKRHSGCHGKCKDYKDWKRLEDEDHEEQRKIREEETKWREIEAERRNKLRQTWRRKQ